MRQAPSAGALDQYSVNSSQGKDVIYQPLYDYQTYVAAGQTSLTFFQNPIGQSGKTLEDTNMEGAGSLPTPQLFIVEAIHIDFFAGNPVSQADAVMENWNDTNDFMKGGWLDFVVGSKSRLQQAPLGSFPPPYRLGGAMQSVANNGDYSSMAGQTFQIIPVTLPATQNFKVTLNWATPVPISVDARVGVKLCGSLFRSVQ